MTRRSLFALLALASLARCAGAPRTIDALLAAQQVPAACALLTDRERVATYDETQAWQRWTRENVAVSVRFSMLTPIAPGHDERRLWRVEAQTRRAVGVAPVRVSSLWVGHGDALEYVHWTTDVRDGMQLTIRRIDAALAPPQANRNLLDALADTRGAQAIGAMADMFTLGFAGQIAGAMRAPVPDAIDATPEELRARLGSIRALEPLWNPASLSMRAGEQREWLSPEVRRRREHRPYGGEADREDCYVALALDLTAGECTASAVQSWPIDGGPRCERWREAINGRRFDTTRGAR